MHWCMGPFTGEMPGAFYLDEFMKSDAMDALVAQPSYVRRLPGNPVGTSLPLASFTRCGKLYIDEPKMMRLYELIPPELPVLFHVGDVRYDYSSPKRLANMMDHFPHLKNIIAAHMGGYSVWDESWKHLVGRDVWFDTSSTFFKRKVISASSQAYS